MRRLHGFFLAFLPLLCDFPFVLALIVPALARPLDLLAHKVEHPLILVHIHLIVQHFLLFFELRSQIGGFLLKGELRELGVYVVNLLQDFLFEDVVDCRL